MNRKLLAFIASGALALPTAVHSQAQEEAHEHMSQDDHVHVVPDKHSHLHEHTDGEKHDHVHPHPHYHAVHSHEDAGAVEIEVSGHINRALLFGDDMITGADSDVKHSDGGASPSRFRMTGSKKLDGGMTAGVNLEYGVGATGGANPGLRHSAVSLSGEFGKLTLGHTSPASDGVAYSNYDNYAWAAGIEIGCDFCTGLPTYQGSRTQVVRYDTSNLGPATVAVSADGNDFFDAALRVDADAGAGKYQFKAGYGNTDGKQKNFAMSGAFGLANGSHFNAAWGQTDPDMGEKLSYWHIGLGHNFGDSSVAATYTDHEDRGGTKSWGVGVGHGMGGAVDLYAGYKNLSYDMETADRMDHGFFVVGSRVKFN